jgi:hypothetical protein
VSKIKHVNINDEVSLFVTYLGVDIVTYVGEDTKSVSLTHEDFAAIVAEYTEPVAA